MSEFEFISVLMSMVVGLGIAHLLRGVAQAVHERKQSAVTPVHLVWTAVILLNLALNWWVLFSWRTTDVWSFTLFLSLIVWVVALYMPVVFLYPPNKPSSESWVAVYSSNRRWFLGALACAVVADVWVTVLRGDVFDPPIYLPFVGHLFVLWLWGVFEASPRYHKVLAWYSLMSLVAWSVIVRRFLV